MEVCIEGEVELLNLPEDMLAGLPEAVIITCGKDKSSKKQFLMVI